MSIILPIYNVEAYLEECLDSLAAQTFVEYEVVVVDDGSPDGSRRIAERYASTDKRIRVVTRENGGLGAARNTGVANARGRFLTFVDSDDRLPPWALGCLVDSARRTGSDIVVGAMQRFSSNRSWRPQWVGHLHAQRREAITIESFPALVRNLYTCDKLFRHDFWKQQGLRFREGVAYEDQPIVTQLYVRARGVDVLPDVVYDYRSRDDRSSISQQTASVSDLRQRILAWQVSRETLRREVPVGIYEAWLQTLFDAHFHWYLNSPGTVDDTYWSELQKAVSALTSDAPQSVWDATMPDKRIVLELTRQDRRADVLEFIRRESRRLDRWRAVPAPDGVLLELPFVEDPHLDRSLFLLRPEQLTLAHSVENFHWLDGTADRAGTFSVAGWAFLAKIDLSREASTVSVVLRGLTTGVERCFPATRDEHPASVPPIDDSWCDYRPGAFRARVPMDEVVGDEGSERTWEVLLRVSAAGFTRTEPATHLVRRGSAGVIPAVWLGDGRLVKAEWRQSEPLRLRVVPVSVSAVDVTLEGRVLAGSLSGPGVGGLTEIVVAGSGVTTSGSLDIGAGGEARFRVELPPAESLSVRKPVHWRVMARTSDHQARNLPWADPSVRPELSEATLDVRRSLGGNLKVVEWAVRAVAEELLVGPDDVLHVRGSLCGTGDASAALTLRSSRSSTVGPATPVQQGRFEAVLPLTYDLFRFGPQPLPTGDHELSVMLRTGEDERLDVPLQFSRTLSDALPMPLRTDVHEGLVVRGPEGAVRLSLTRPIGEARGRYRQRRLREAVAQRPERVTHGVLMRSYFGELATDNGVALQRELRRRGSDLPVYWAVQDHSVPVPDGGIPVVVNSREWYELLSSVTYYVDNMYQPEYHHKPAGQVIVQTFHGYPFKRMGHPHWQNLRVSQERIDAYDKRAAEWDYLVSPARYATPLLARDFAYAGTILEIGYPRNDVLQSPEADTIRAATRGSLGISEGQTAVLYAPTFRDYLAHNDNRARMADFFDIEAAAGALGEGMVILVRGHAFNARTRRRVERLPNVVEVTDYPEVSDLYLAADVAVVDYSSLRFDFGVTGKPMIFHVPDLQRYQDTRGWLFPFEATAPGPLVNTTEEVVSSLLDLDGVRSRHADDYATFKATYLDLEDGRAAERFVDAVFVPRGDA